MKMRVAAGLVMTVLFLAGCGMKGPAESEYLSISDECKTYAAKLPGLADAATVNAELDQCAKRIGFHTGQLARQISKKGKAAVRGSIGNEARVRFNRDIGALIQAVGAAEAKFGKAAIAPGVRAVKGAIARLGNTL